MTKIASNVRASATILVLAIGLSTVTTDANAELDISGKAALSQRYFLQDSDDFYQERAGASFATEWEFYKAFDNGTDSIVFKPFYRYDQHDDERTHGDIRELLWHRVGDDWEFKLGVGKVFWGQTESMHLVDVINQTDLVESVDGEDKLGQPMVSLALIRDWGTVTGFVLPYFRERTFPGIDGRPSFNLPIDIDNPLYESEDGEKNIDWALRWQHSLGDWELGLAYFDGTSREPEFVAQDTEGNPSLAPLYRQMQQTSIDALGVYGSWLLKFEGIQRKLSDETFFAGVVGFEYTYVGLFESDYDLGLLMEYQKDNRNNGFIASGQNDVMTGTRLVFNNFSGTEVLLAYVQDLDESSSRSGYIEASSRINDQWKWQLDAWFFSSELPSDPIYQFRRGDYLEFSLDYYF